MKFKNIVNEIKLKPVHNKKNGQINFSLKKNSLPKEIKDKLSKLKEIKFNIEDMNFF